MRVPHVHILKRSTCVREGTQSVNLPVGGEEESGSGWRGVPRDVLWKQPPLVSLII